MTTSNCGLGVTEIWGSGTAAGVSIAPAPSEAAADVSFPVLAVGTPYEDRAFDPSSCAEDGKVSREVMSDHRSADSIDS